MSYTIYHANGTPVPVPDAIIDTEYYNPAGGDLASGLGIQFIGDKAINYGAAIAQNFLQMTENFSSANVPNDTTSLQGQLWFNRQSSTAGDLYVRTKDNTAGGILNWNKLIVADTSGNVNVGGTVNATSFTGDGSALTGINIGVSSIVAGANITISPSGGTGAVTISAANEIVVGVSTFNTRAGAVMLTSSDVTSALGFTPATSGSGVLTFNTRTGAVILTSLDVTTALGFTPASAASVVTSVGVASAGSTISVTGSPITSSGSINIDLPTTGVTAGAYTSANISVDAYGRVTSASSNSTGSLGVGQSWNIMIINGTGAGGRWSGVAYYNSTPLPIFVSVSTAASTDVDIVATVAGNTIAHSDCGNKTGSVATLSFIVPPGDTQYTVTSSVGLSYWSELR